MQEHSPHVHTEVFGTRNVKALAAAGELNLGLSPCIVLGIRVIDDRLSGRTGMSISS